MKVHQKKGKRQASTGPGGEGPQMRQGPVRARGPAGQEGLAGQGGGGGGAEEGLGPPTESPKQVSLKWPRGGPVGPGRLRGAQGKLQRFLQGYLKVASCRIVPHMFSYLQAPKSS